MKQKEIYISTDVETNGPIPGKYSMLSLGSVALTPKGKVISKFYRKLKPLPRAKQHKSTMDWWKENPKAYKEVTSKAENPRKVMGYYKKWLQDLKEKTGATPIFLGWPLSFDYLFTYWYFINFVKEFENWSSVELPFCYNQTIDVISFVMGKSGEPYLKSRSPNVYKKFIGDFKLKENNHNSVDDALNQGKEFIKMLNNKKKK